MTQQPIKREVEKIILPSNVLEYISEYSPPAFDKEPKVIEINHATYACKLAYAASKQVGEENRRLREMLEKVKTFLFKHQEWEAGVISEDTFWWPKSDKDTLRGKVYEDFCELQVERNKCFEAINALASVSDGKQKEE